MGKFEKFDGDKVRYDLVPPSMMNGIAGVLTFGADKYEAHNWKNVDDPERYVGALFRHIEAWRAGETFDPDSGLPHLAHASTNLAFLIELNYEPKTWSNK